MKKYWMLMTCLLLFGRLVVGLPVRGIKKIASRVLAETSFGLADSPWPMYHGGPKHGGQSKVDTSLIKGTLKWKFETGGGIESSPVIGPDGTIYVGSHDNKLYAINPEGTKKWEFFAGEPAYDDVYQEQKGILSVPAIAKDGTIYFSSLNDFIFAINPDGTEKWRHELPITSDNWTSPVIGSDGTIYTGGARRKLEGTNESEYYAEPIGGFYAFNPDGILKWHFKAQSDTPGSLALGDDETVYGYVAEGKQQADGYIKAVSKDGKEKWKYHIIFSESSPTIASDGTIYIGAGHERRGLVALDREGKEKWFYPTRDDISAIPAVGKDGTIYVGQWDGTFYAFNPDGTVKWEVVTPKITESITASAAIGAEGTIYIGANSGIFYALNPDGTVKWKYEAGSAFVSSPAIGADGTIYVGAWDKNLYAFGGSEKEKVSSTIEQVLPKVEILVKRLRRRLIPILIFVVVGGSLVLLVKRGGQSKKWLFLILMISSVAGVFVFFQTSKRRLFQRKPDSNNNRQIKRSSKNLCLTSEKYEEISDPKAPVLSMPFDFNNYTTKHWGIIPFCAKLRNGQVHGALDFELKPNSKIYAAADGVIENTQTGEAEGSGEIISVRGDGFNLGYSGLTNLQVKVGDVIKRGDYLAKTLATPFGEHHVHLGISIDGNEECPLKYMDEPFLAAFEEMFARADYQFHTEALCACNCEVISPD